MRAWIVLGALLVSVPARADRDEDARALYEEGRVAFEQDRAQEAYDRFREAYMISQRPQLLFNMASALTRLDRPHEAAESLRAYLRVVPDDPDRASLEQRIRALEEKQRLLDEERRAREPHVVAPVVAPALAPPAKRPLYKRWWLWAIVGGVAAG